MWGGGHDVAERRCQAVDENVLLKKAVRGDGIRMCLGLRFCWDLLRLFALRRERGFSSKKVLESEVSCDGSGGWV